MISTTTTISTLNPSGPLPGNVALLFHGLGSSKDEWLEPGGYTHGGLVTRGLSELGIPWIAADQYGHGGFAARQSDFDPEDISDELWPDFLGESARVYVRMLRELGVAVESPQNPENPTPGARKQQPRIHLISYSGGIQVACEVIRQAPGLEVASICAAVPPPDKDADDEYSLHNNREVFTRRPSLLIFADQDEHISAEEARWFAGQVACPATKVIELPGGHSLPESWAQEFLKWFRQHL